MSFYWIPVRQRFTRIHPDAPAIICAGKYVRVDGIGLFVEYAKEDLATPENIRRHHTLVRNTFVIVEAENLEGAIEQFYQNFEGAAKDENPAIWIDSNKERVITKYPYCEHLSRTKNGRFICGPKIRNEDCGSRGMCVLEWGIDPPDGHCPIDEMIIDKTKAEQVSINGQLYYFIDAEKK